VTDSGGSPYFAWNWERVLTHDLRLSVEEILTLFATPSYTQFLLPVITTRSCGTLDLVPAISHGASVSTVHVHPMQRRALPKMRYINSNCLMSSASADPLTIGLPNTDKKQHHAHQNNNGIA
jgi:hypothetical protein